MTPQLLRAATGCTQDAADLYADHLAATCEAFDINTPTRLAAFLAQVGHESGSLRHVREVWGPTPAQERYEGRKDLGNLEPGDGFRYRGRGLIQCTGRDNYRRITQWLSAYGAPDFEHAPEALEDPQWAVWSAAAWWAKNGCNEIADSGDFQRLTKRINGGLNGRQDRLRRWERARSALGNTEPAAQANTQTKPAAQAEPKEATMSTIGNIAAAAAPLVGGPAGLLIGLAGTLFEAFAPLAKEKATKELARHTSPEVAAQVADAAVGAAMRFTGRADPVEAGAEARKDPAAMEAVQQSVMEQLDRLAPMLERMAKLDRQTYLDEEASRAAAHARGNPMDAFLTYSIVWMLAAVVAGSVVLVGVLAWLKVDNTLIMAVFAILNGACMVIVSKFGTRHDFAYGSSAGSQNKDALMSMTKGRA